MEVICMGCNGGDYAWWGIMYGGVCVGGGEGWRGNCPWDLRYILPQLVIHSLYLCGQDGISRVNFFFQLRATEPDGTPIAGEVVTITANIHPGISHYQETFKVPANGLVDFTINVIGNDTKSLSITVSHTFC